MAEARTFSLADPAPPPPDAGPAVARPGVDLRLVPAALLTWAATALTLTTSTTISPGWLLLPVAVVTGAVAWRRGAPTVALPAATVTVAVAATLIRRARAAAHPIAEGIRGGMGDMGGGTDGAGAVKETVLTLTTTPKATDHGATAQASVAGLPGRVRVFGDERLLDHDRGTVLEAYAKISASDRPSLSGVTASLRGTVDVVKHPDDHISRVRDGLRDAAAGLPVGPDRLIPAMTLGDERGFGAADQKMMVDSGLAHLSAVSGANLALVMGAAVWALSWAPPRWRVAAAAVTLVAFVAVVGTEPSVLRALLTGTVGLLAVLLGRRGQAVPALMAGTIVLVVAFPDLAVSIGFALSVAATAGLVLAAAPMTHRLLRIPGVARLPAPLVRATAVALVAHIATVPVLALTLGEVSHISVVANLAAAPAVAPVTVAGTLAAVAALLGLGPVVTVLVWVAAPFAWWVHAVGHAAAGMPGAAGEMGLVGVAVFLVTAAAAVAWPSVAAAVTCVAMGAAGVVIAFGWHIPAAPPGWVAGACVDDGRVLVVAAMRDDGHRHALPRHCRLALAGAAAEGNGGDAGAAVTRGGGAATMDARPLAEELTVYATLDEAEKWSSGATGQPGGVGAGARPRWLVVADCGDRARDRIRTTDGIPVVCPVRDGTHALYPDGAVWRSGAAWRSGAGAGGAGKSGSDTARSGESGTMGE
ncbi:ComEC/Rec2 family competence protein [Corynebacterium freneyi]|uniref:ComEC/Rec2 family competence protein n=1 Tax=Corynebacterium freneyi TaxID=134034 RepID=UPI00254BEF58|nr:ComEC/Rec2 family competence protein [Corynebacterium freneyi]MDK8768169.1 ComEC/Rec2 family competence protein [Corynebacterium freneyi]